MRAIQSESGTRENENLKKQLAQREAELSIINSVGEAMSKQLDVNTVTKIVGDKIREIFSAEVTEILLLDHETEMIHLPYSYSNGYQTYEAFKLGEGLASKIINSRKPLRLNTLEEQTKSGGVIQSDEDKTESYIGVPIIFLTSYIKLAKLWKCNELRFSLGTTLCFYLITKGVSLHFSPSN